MIEADMEHGRKPATSHLMSQHETGRDRSVFCLYLHSRKPREKLWPRSHCVRRLRSETYKLLLKREKGGFKRELGTEEKRL